MRKEPEEKQKVVVAGLVEAHPKKDYPDTFFGRAAAVMRGEMGLLFKSTLFFILFTIPFIVIFAWFAGYFQDLTIGGTYNFMGDVGIVSPVAETA